LRRETALGVAAALGGGLGHMGETCGAVAGALMVIGLRYGKTRTDDKEAADKTYAIAKELIDEFRSHHGTVRCKELLGVDISTPEGYALIREKGIAKTMCGAFIKDAAEIAEKILKR
jgi:C_GCAxxG_C_C family probable redox protein